MSAQTSAYCRFVLTPTGYSCQLENVNATSIADIIDLSGIHIGNRTNADVNDVTAGQTAILEEIPSMIFQTFGNLIEFTSTGNNVRSINLPYCGPRMKTLSINFNSISHLQNGAFRGCRSVESLALRATGIERIEDNVFYDLPQLRELIMFGNPLGEIQAHLFRNQHQLEYLRLDQGTISTIHHGIFQCKDNLRYMDLFQNRLEMISTGTFTNMPNLTYVNLASNSIRNIEEGAFANLPLLETLNLMESHIVILDSKLFGTSFPNLRSLSVNSNEINAVDRRIFDRFPALQYIGGVGNLCFSISFIDIESIESDVLPYMDECFQNFDNL